MNNEDKILALLEQLHQGQTATNVRLDKIDTRLDKVDSRLDQMDARFDQVDSRFDQMDARMDKMDTRMDKMDSRLDVMQEDIAVIKEVGLKIEHEITPKVRSLYDGHKLNTQRLDCIQKTLDEMASTVNALDILHLTALPAE